MVESVELEVQEVLTGGVCSETWTANSNNKQVENKHMGYRRENRGASSKESKPKSNKR